MHLLLICDRFLSLGPRDPLPARFQLLLAMWAGKAMEPQYKLAKNVKIAMLYLEDDDPVSAEMFIKKASSLLTSTKDPTLELQYKVCCMRSSGQAAAADCWHSPPHAHLPAPSLAFATLRACCSRTAPASCTPPEQLATSACHAS